MATRDSQTFDEFYMVSARRVVAQVYALVGDLTEAEDAVQEAFARAWQRWSRLSTYEDPASWVRTVAYRICVGRWRRLRRQRRAHQRHGPLPDTPALSPDTVALVAALRHIPDNQRMAVVLHHLGGLTVAEIAREQGVPVNTVKSRLTRGRQALAAYLSSEEATNSA